MEDHERRLRSQKEFMVEHSGHESMHQEMAMIFLWGLIICQIALFYWRRKSFSSYRTVSLFGCWVIPLYFWIKLSHWNILIVWLTFSIINAMVMWAATRPTLNSKTPRRVYTWFVVTYKLSYGSGLLGYLIILSSFFGLNTLLGISTDTYVSFGVVLVFYGLYFGIIVRDFAELATESLASSMGYSSREGHLSQKQYNPLICMICGDNLRPQHSHQHLKMLHTDVHDTSIDAPIELHCSHVYHEFCIRGWMVVGKRQTCPFCMEKVDLKKLITNAWEKPHGILFGQLLDIIRYLVVWQPVLFVVLEVIFYFRGLE